jgi:RimJ/RimL family protein N-acetyltransferase
MGFSSVQNLVGFANQSRFTNAWNFWLAVSQKFGLSGLAGHTVVALVQFIPCDPIEGEPCFNVGWAVAEAYRGQGKAHGAVSAAIKEMQNGFNRAGMNAFWVEAVVGEDNIASQRLAEKVLSGPAKKATDSYSGDPIVQYLRRIDGQSEL